MPTALVYVSLGDREAALPMARTGLRGTIPSADSAHDQPAVGSDPERPEVPGAGGEDRTGEPGAAGVTAARLALALWLASAAGKTVAQQTPADTQPVLRPTRWSWSSTAAVSSRGSAWVM